MPKMKCLIVDNDLVNSNFIHGKIEQYFSSIGKVDISTEAHDALHQINISRPDLVFLNIHLKKISGIALLQQLHPLDFQVIFTIDANQPLVRTPNFSCLKKPISDAQFIEAVNNCMVKHSKKIAADWVSQAVHGDFNYTKGKKIAIPTSEGYVIKKMEEIVRIESKNRYAIIYFKDNTNHESSYNLGKYKTMLSGGSFIQSHKSHLVNEEHITEYHKSGFLVLSNGDRVPISSSRRKSVLNQIRGF